MKIQPFFWGARLAALAVGLVLASVPSGCSQPQKASVSFRVSAKDIETSGANLPGSSGQAVALGLVQPARSANFTFRDVNRITISVYDGTTPLFTNVPMLEDPALEGDWTATIPFLPRDVPLTFVAEAFQDEEKLFEGLVHQTLTADNQTVTLRLAPVTNNPIRMPRIRRIFVPAEFISEQGDNVNFSLESHLGDRLTFEITPAPGGGQFVPATGNLRLLTTLGAFVSQYIPPAVAAETTFVHSVKVTNEDGYTIITTFRTLVRPISDIPWARDTRLQVLFNPVITGLEAERTASQVLWRASVSSQSNATITYNWSFAPNGTFDPAPAIVNPAANPAVLQNYTEAVQGVLTLEVMEGADAATTTTLQFNLTPNHFPADPTTPAPTTGVVNLAAGSSHTCALRDNGAVRCWGTGDSGRLGYGNELTVGRTNPPWQAGDVPETGTVKQLAAGGAHTCALVSPFTTPITGGFVRCWGDNAYGQLGYAHTRDIGDGERVGGAGYVQLGGLARRIVAGGQHSCALMDTGRVRCWGRNNYGQLGYGNTATEPAVGDDEPAWSFGDVDLNGDLAQDIAAGYDHTCALLRNGRVRCWGRNDYGQLGYGNTTPIGDDELPGSVGSIDVAGPAVRIRANGYATCALLAVGTVRCWGDNTYGQNGLGDASGWPWHATFRAAPELEVNLGDSALDIAVGGQHVCALLAGGGVKCWGRGDNGQLGLGNFEHRYAPATDPIPMDSGVRIASGAAHTCVLLSTGRVRCWGSNALGQIGYPNINNVSLPTENVQVLNP